MVPLRNRAALGKIVMNMTELRRLQGKNATMLDTVESASRIVREL